MPESRRHRKQGFNFDVWHECWELQHEQAQAFKEPSQERARGVPHDEGDKGKFYVILPLSTYLSKGLIWTTQERLLHSMVSAR